ncbi:MAG: thioredoxin family protein [Bacteroidales bacterium]|jgi:thiol:disulfide interchange protein DsbD|nr:thioredoxin family protein [Bacteroidales bacterium]
MRKRLISSLLLLSAITFLATAQVLKPVKWKYNSKKVADKEYELTFEATLETNWHLYTMDLPDGGPVPTSIIFEEPNGYELVGKTEQLSEIHKMYDKTFEMDITYFSDKALFKQRIKLTTDKKVNVKAIIEYQVCDDAQCLFLDEEKVFVFNKDAEALAVKKDENEIKEQKEKAIDALIEKSEKTEVDVQTSTDEKSNASLWFIFFAAFLAGLFAIATPCVFPMIPMTVSFFMHGSENRAKAIRKALFFGFSIIGIYTIVGTVVAVTLGASFANLLSTHWIPNMIFFLIFIIFAASFFGMFEITLPSWIANKSDAQVDKGGIFGPFFMALTLVVVSFSCTGPFVGSILVESATGQVIGPIIGMLGFSLAFALPFTIFAIFPSLLSKLPKSGGWLNTVKVVLGFIELGFAFKFLSVVDQTYHWGYLDREIYIAIWVVIATLLGMYLLGKLKFAHDSDIPHIGVPRLFLAIASFTFAVYLFPGMFGAPLKALSGYLPPQTTHDFDIKAIVRNNSIVMDGKNGESGLCEKPKYSDFLHLEHGLKGYFDYEQGLKCAKEKNKPVFIDFTGHGCVNCREMEAKVWSDPRVLKRLKEDFIIIALYVDDKTKLPEEDWVTSTVDGKVKKTLGKKYSDFQISRFNVNAQPYYVPLDTNGKLLVDPQAYDLDVDNFVEFLDKALEEFKKRQ